MRQGWSRVGFEEEEEGLRRRILIQMGSDRKERVLSIATYLWIMRLKLEGCMDAIKSLIAALVTTGPSFAESVRKV